MSTRLPAPNDTIKPHPAPAGPSAGSGHHPKISAGEMRTCAVTLPMMAAAGNVMLPVPGRCRCDRLNTCECNYLQMICMSDYDVTSCRRARAPRRPAQELAMHNWIRTLSRRGVLSGGIMAAGGALLAALTSERPATAQGAH